MFNKLIHQAPRTSMSVGAVLLAAVPVTKSKETAAAAAEPDLSHYHCKRSELPLYAPLHSRNKPVNVSHAHMHPKQSPLRDSIESAVRVVRTEIQSGYEIVEKQKDSVVDLVSTAKAHTQSTIDYLNQPHNILPRTGAIAIGGLAGFIFAARGGFIKKIFYTSTGAGVVASLCYPQQASVAARDALYEARKGYAIAYNFVKGVKPGEEVPIEPINKFPTTAEDVKHMFWDLYDETMETLFPKKK